MRVDKGGIREKRDGLEKREGRMMRGIHLAVVHIHTHKKKLFSLFLNPASLCDLSHCIN